MKIIDAYFQEWSLELGFPEASYIVEDDDIEHCVSVMIQSGAIKVDTKNPGDSVGCSPVKWPSTI